jgi:hypothetical protein
MPPAELQSAPEALAAFLAHLEHLPEGVRLAYVAVPAGCPVPIERGQVVIELKTVDGSDWALVVVAADLPRPVLDTERLAHAIAGEVMSGVRR